MATATIYTLCTFDKNDYSVAITGNIKIKTKSQLDDDVGVSQRIITPKLVTGKTDNKVVGRLLTIITGFEYLKKLTVSSADRSYIWSIDKDLVELINKNSPLTLIETLKGMDIPEEMATHLAGKLYGYKMELGTRVAYHDKTKSTNRFVDMAQKMLAEQSAPAIPDWSEALEKAKRKAQMESMKNELSAMEQIQQDDNTIADKE
tara:strand:- start:1762 stop:2373 length:612 start_codon:yes stop_codon:yes gene_type:complete